MLGPTKVHALLSALGWNNANWENRDKEPTIYNNHIRPPDAFYMPWSDLLLWQKQHAEGKSIFSLVRCRFFRLNSSPLHVLKGLGLTKKRGMLHHWPSMSSLTS